MALINIILDTLKFIYGLISLLSVSILAMLVIGFFIIVVMPLAAVYVIIEALYKWIFFKQIPW